MQVLAYDTETNGPNPHHGNTMFAYSTADCTTGETDVRRLDGGAARRAASMHRMQHLFSGAYELALHNSKFDLLMTEGCLGKQVVPGVRFHDTYLQAHLLMNDHPSHSLKDLGWELCGIPKDDERKVRAWAKGGDYSKVPEWVMHPYQEGDALRTALLHAFFWGKISKSPKLRELYQVEIDLIEPTMRMEQRGIMLDVPRCRAMVADYTAKAAKVLDDVEAATGRRLNLNTSNHCQWLLYHWAGLPVLARTPTGLPSTDKDNLLLLRQAHQGNQAIEWLMQYRSWSRGATMLAGYETLAGPGAILHPTIYTCEAATGRESCRNPNLQNVQKAEVLLNPYPVPARMVFRPRPGFVLVLIDYAGIEMRLLVHYADEGELVAIARSGGDIHEPAARVFFEDAFINATDPRVRKSLRNAAKNANFATPYGAGAATVAATLNLPGHVAHIRYMNYRQRFPKLVNLGRTVSQEVNDTGGVTTQFGRFLRVPRDKAYMGLNYKIQGTAAEVLKRAQVRLAGYLRQAAGPVHMLLPVHDEIILEVPRDRLRDLPDILGGIRERMVAFPEFKVPLDIDVSIATRSWAEKRDYTWNAK